MSEEQPVRVRQRTQPVRAVNLETPREEVHLGYILATRVNYSPEETVREEVIQVPLFTTHPARVKVAGGTTRNQGDYNSARFDISVELPCYPEASEIRRAKDYASQLVDMFLYEEMQAAGLVE